MLEPLKNTAYRHLFAAQVIALLGTGFTTVALALLAYDLAGDRAGTVLGMALALKMVAYVVVAPIVSGLAASLPRKIVLVVLDLVRAAFVLCLPFVTEIWQIYLIIFLMQSCSAGFTPMFQAIIPNIITDEKGYTKALSLSRLAYDLESLLSPSLAAAALLYLSFDALFATNAIAFLISAVLVLTAVLPRQDQDQEEVALSVWDKASFGIRAYLATPRLRGVLALFLAVAAAGAMVIVNTVVLIRGEFGLTDQDVALAMASYGGGSMLAAFILPRILEKISDRPVMLVGAVFLAVGLLLGAIAPSFVWLLPVWGFLGASAALINTPTGRLLRRSSTEKDRPAYFAAQFSLSHACWLITYPLVGWLGVSLGMTLTFCVMAGIVFLGFCVAFVLWPKEEEDRILHTHKNLPEGHPHLVDAIEVRDGFQHIHEYKIDRNHQAWPKRNGE